MTDSEKDNLENNENEDDNLKYYDFDDDTIHTLFFKKVEIDKIKIEKIEDYYDLFVSMLKMGEKDLYTHEHLWVIGIDATSYAVCAYIVTLGYSNFFKVDSTRLFRTALQHNSVKIIIGQSKPNTQNLKVTLPDLDLTNTVYHKAEILGLELVDHLLISNLSIKSKTPLHCSHLENGVICFVKKDKTYKSYDVVKPELERIRKEFGAEQKREGLIEGKREEKVEIAKNLLKNNVDINIIISSTGLAIEEVNKIKKDMGL